MPALDRDEVAPADDIHLHEFPGWMAWFGAVRTGRELWLWLAPAHADADATMGQAVLEVPGGRYLGESYDVEAGAWVARESVLAPPLVIGVPRRPGAMVLRVTRTAA